ncbi:DUF29 domain-containing protein [Tautonia rosea]|uniref:DUF29 domain-containing protein n=1 Tax=Tautonia rosea TaxID=2728037 RepID=UPI0014744A26|nr:DUF29 domain-containing protein [Tautonia rosea]
MSNQMAGALPSLYHEDETAWLETMAQLVAEGRFDELDCAHLSEYLSDMARRDRREVYSRLVVLLTHLLKWEHQPEKRSGSWRGTILTQRRELRLLLESGTLRNHAIASLAEAYQDAREQAAAETELPIDTFPFPCVYTVDELIARDSEGDPA